jgi:UDP-glucose 4-epimerase
VVVVTGADSFLGRNIIGLLEQDARVARIVALDTRSPSTAGAKTRFYEFDISQPSSEERMAEVFTAERVGTVVHVAFLATPSHASAWAHEFESVGTMHVLNGARHAKVRKLVQWSQTLLYGARPSNPNYLTEDHGLQARSDTGFFQDKIEAEAQARRFAEQANTVVTILRTAPIVGPTVTNYVTHYLSHRLVPTLMGFDPLVQFVHEVDAVAAFKLAIDRDVPGTFNIVGRGVLALQTAIRLAGRLAVPIPQPLLAPIIDALWVSQLCEVPASFLDYLRYLCVADDERAASVLGLRCTHTTREALLDFAAAQQLRDVHLLNEPESQGG